MMFYLGLALLMVLLAAVLVFFPWLKIAKAKRQDMLTNTLLIKQRLQELELEQQQGLLSEEDKLQAVNELKMALLDETEQSNTQQSAAAGIVVIGAVLVLAVASGSYYYANKITAIQDWQLAVERLPELGKRVVIEADETIQVKDLQDFALGLRTRLAQKPEDATGWLLLGRVFAAVNRLDSALEAFQKALDLDPDKPGVLSSYSQALVMTGQPEYLQKAQQLLQHLLSIEPDDNDALGMLAITASQLGNKELAIKSWQQLQQNIPETAPVFAQIGERIAALQSATEPSAVADTGSGSVTQGPVTSILINVSVARELKDKLPTDAYLFVFAQDASGEVRMPAAVVKTRLATLPVQIELSDSNAMMPDYTLSKLRSARLVARISLDENVATAQGELQGEVVIEVVNGTKSEQKIEINKELM